MSSGFLILISILWSGFCKCRELDAQKSPKQVKVPQMEMLNREGTLKRNLYFVLALILHLSFCYHLGKKTYFLHQNCKRLKRLYEGTLLWYSFYVIVVRLLIYVVVCSYSFSLQQIATRMVIQYGWGPDDSTTIYHHSNAVLIIFFCYHWHLSHGPVYWAWTNRCYKCEIISLAVLDLVFVCKNTRCDWLLLLW